MKKHCVALLVMGWIVAIPSAYGTAIDHFTSDTRGNFTHWGHSSWPNPSATWTIDTSGTGTMTASSTNPGGGGWLHWNTQTLTQHGEALESSLSETALVSAGIAVYNVTPAQGLWENPGFQSINVHTDPGSGNVRIMFPGWPVAGWDQSPMEALQARYVDDNSFVTPSLNASTKMAIKYEGVDGADFLYTTWYNDRQIYTVNFPDAWESDGYRIRSTSPLSQMYLETQTGGLTSDIVKWDYVALVPEPASLSLLGLAISIFWTRKR